MFLTLILLLFAGQTVIFLLRLVAADRREGVRHAPRAAGATPTVGQLEDAAAPESASQDDDAAAPAGTTAPVPGDDQPADPGVRE